MTAHRSAEQTLKAFFDTLPWPVLIVDERGLITFVNQASQASVDKAHAVPGRLLGDAFPHYFAALQGKVPWLTPQEAVAERTVDGADVVERVVLRPLMRGACLFIMRLPDADRGLGDAQLARLASIGFMVAGVCHEVANPLTAINSTVQLLRSNSQCPPALLEKGLSNIATNVQRVLNISRKLNDFSRAGEDARAALNLRATVTDAVSLVLHDALMRDVSVDCQLDATTLVRGDSSQLQQVFCNVLTNAAQAMQGRGNLFIADTRPDAACVEVAIRDTGPGIHESALPRLFEPFFTTKPPGQGTGLGLAISNEIVISHGGSMRAANDAQGGACFYVRLPAMRS